MKKEIVICLGSSCFSRGNKKQVQLIKAFLETHCLNDVVNFRGSHCFNRCEEGPILSIDGKENSGMTPERVTQVLENEFLSKGVLTAEDGHNLHH